MYLGLLFPVEFMLIEFTTLVNIFWMKISQFLIYCCRKHFFFPNFLSAFPFWFKFSISEKDSSDKESEMKFWALLIHSWRHPVYAEMWWGHIQHIWSIGWLVPKHMPNYVFTTFGISLFQVSAFVMQCLSYVHLPSLHLLCRKILFRYFRRRIKFSQYKQCCVVEKCSDVSI